MNYLRKLRYRKGFTLVELIVVVALIAIIVVCVAAFSSPVNAMVKGSKAKSDALTINKIIGDYLERRLGFANDIEIVLNCDASSSSTVVGTKTLSTLLTSYRAGGVTDPDDAEYGDVGGAIVIRLIEGPDAGALPAKWSDPQTKQNSTYRIYDINGATAAWPSSASDWENWEVFDPSFYSDYEFFINLDAETISRMYNGGKRSAGGGNTVINKYLFNKNKNRFFINFEVKSYDFSEEYPDNRLVKSAGSARSTLGIDTLMKIGSSDSDKQPTAAEISAIDHNERQKSGTESISILLSNIKVNPNSQTDPDNPSDGIDYQPKGDFSVDGFEPAYFTGSDIVIFYHTKHYKN